MDFRADLHCHSCYSDGTNTPFEILDLAKKVNLNVISITDHDTLSSYFEKGIFEYAEKIGICLIPGVEISSVLNKEGVHILGINIDLSCISFLDFLKDVQEKRQRRNLAILQKLADRGFDIAEEDLKKLIFYKNGEYNTSLGRAHMAHVLHKKGYVSSYKQAFELYLKDGGSCYVAGEKFSPGEIIAKIHEAKGKAFIAHPHLIKRRKVLQELFSLPFDGYEKFYSRLGKFNNSHFEKLAEEKKWIGIGGSDFHGDMLPGIILGMTVTSKAAFDRILFDPK